MSEEPRCPFRNEYYPASRSSVAAVQPFVLPRGPSDNVVVNTTEKWIQPGLVEATVIIDPPLHNNIHQLCKVVQRLVRAAIDPPAPQLLTHLREGVAAHGWLEAGKDFASFSHCAASAKRVSQEVEPLVGIGSSTVRVLAIHDARLVWV